MSTHDAAWHEARAQGIGSSDAAKIMAGDWFPLWQEKVGEAKPKSIMSPWDAALRLHVEPLILDWHAEKFAQAVTRRREMLTNSMHPFMRCELDGYVELAGSPIDAKFLSAWTPGDAIEWAREKYTWQIYHQCIVTGSTQGILGICHACKEPEYITIPIEQARAEELIERERVFWSYVESLTPPPDAPAILAPANGAALKKVSMQGSNSWASFAADWLINKEAASTFEKAKVGMKELIAPDVGEATGHGVRAKRDRAGAIRFSQEA